MTQIRNKQVKFDSNINFTTLRKITNLADGTTTNEAINKGQLDAVSALIGALEWQNSVLTSTVLNPVAETPVAGARYLINGTGAGGFLGHSNEIATYVAGVVTSPASWSFTVPTTGMFVGADNLPEQIFLYGGSSWAAKNFEASTASNGLTKVGFDIRIDAASAFFIEAAQDAVGAAVANSARVTLTYNDGSNTITADLVVNTINEDYLLGLGTGTAGQIVTSDGALGFVYVDQSTIQDTEKRTVNASAVTTGNAQLAVTDVFGSDNPRNNTIPQVFIGGAFVRPALSDATRATSDCYFGNVSGVAIALNALTGTENLYFNGTVAGYDLDAADEIVVNYSI